MRPRKGTKTSLISRIWSSSNIYKDETPEGDENPITVALVPVIVLVIYKDETPEGDENRGYFFNYP